MGSYPTCLPRRNTQTGAERRQPEPGIEIDPEELVDATAEGSVRGGGGGGGGAMPPTYNQSTMQLKAQHKKKKKSSASATNANPGAGGIATAGARQRGSLKSAKALEKRRKAAEKSDQLELRKVKRGLQAERVKAAKS